MTNFSIANLYVIANYLIPILSVFVWLYFISICRRTKSTIISSLVILYGILLASHYLFHIKLSLWEDMSIVSVFINYNVINDVYFKCGYMQSSNEMLSLDIFFNSTKLFLFVVLGIVIEALFKYSIVIYIANIVYALFLIAVVVAMIIDIKRGNWSKARR